MLNDFTKNEANTEEVRKETDMKTQENVGSLLEPVTNPTCDNQYNETDEAEDIDEENCISIEAFLDEWVCNNYPISSYVGMDWAIDDFGNYSQICGGSYIFPNEVDGETYYFEIKPKEKIIRAENKANYAVIPKAEIVIISNNPNEKHADLLKAYIVKQGKPDKIELLIVSSDEESMTTLKKRFYKTTVGLRDSYHPKSIKCFNALKKSLHENVPTHKYFKTLGYFPNLNFHVCKNGLFDLNDNIFYFFSSEDNLVHHKNGDIYGLADDIEENFVFNIEADGKEVAKRYFKSVKATFKDVPLQVGLFTALGAAFEDIFWTKQGMPMILFLGKSQSGKSLLQYSIAAIFGMLNSNSSGSSSAKGLRNEVEKYCNVPVFVEELGKERMQELPIICKDIFSRTPRKTSSKDGKTLVQPINTTICACSNEFIPELKPETLSRIIFTDTKESLEKVDTFPFTQTEELSELPAILPEMLKFRPNVEHIYNESFKAISPKVGIEKRLCNNLAIASTMATIVNNICGEKIFELNKIIPEYIEFYNQYLFSQGSQIDSIMIELERYIKNNQLHYGRDYLLTGDSNLRLNLSKFLHIYNSGQTKLTQPQCKLILGRGKGINTNATPIGDIGRAIHISISDNQDLLDFLNEERRITKEAEMIAQALLEGKSNENTETN